MTAQLSRVDDDSTNGKECVLPFVCPYFIHNVRMYCNTHHFPEDAHAQIRVIQGLYASKSSSWESFTLQLGRVVLASTITAVHQLCGNKIMPEDMFGVQVISQCCYPER